MRLLCFLKENSYNMVRLFVYQFGMTVFGSSLAMASQANKPLLLITSIFATLFFMYLVYSSMWEIGAKDYIRIEAGRLIPRPALGLCIACGAGMPNYILLLLTYIGFIFASPDIGICADWATGLFSVVHLIFRLLNGMYLGILSIALSSTDASGIMSIENMLMCGATVIPALLSAWLGYFIGAKGKTLRSLIGIKTK
jgi:hypothetical protein